MPRSLNVSEDRVSLVDIRYDGQKWLAGPNGRRLEMVEPRTWTEKGLQHLFQA